MATLGGRMLRRLLIGLMLGLVVGGLAAWAFVAGLRATAFADAGGPLVAGAAAALTGILTGLVAGKPIWASGARIEAGLKAFFGALISVGLMFALRRWAGGWVLDLRVISAGGPATVGDLPAASLPLIGALLGSFFELDNSAAGPGDPKKTGVRAERSRIADGRNGRAKARLAGEEPASTDEEAEVVSKSAKH